LNLRQAVLLRAAAQSHPIGAGRVDFARDHPKQARDYSRLNRQAQAAAAAAATAAAAALETSGQAARDYPIGAVPRRAQAIIRLDYAGSSILNALKQV
jgi:hypothetical protein